MELNDIIQWICVAIILAIACFSAVRGIARIVRARRSGADAGCSCGCSGCALSEDCRKPENTRRKGIGKDA